jgi:hypothetical protein
MGALSVLLMRQKVAQGEKIGPAVAGTFLTVRRPEVVPRSVEVGEGPDPTGRQWAAGNGLTTMLVVDV